MQPHQRAMLDLMIIASAADGRMSDLELGVLTRIVSYMPIFRDVSPGEIGPVAESVAGLLAQDDGIDRAIRAATQVLASDLRETAYAMAIEVIAADEIARQSELELLQMLRDGLDISDLAAAAIEHGARVRHRSV